MKDYTELEKQAQKFLDETDTMQFSTVELLTMFYNHQEQYNKGVNKESEFSIFDWIKKDGDWINVGFTSDGINIKTYVNGELLKTTNFPNSKTKTTN